MRFIIRLYTYISKFEEFYYARPILRSVGSSGRADGRRLPVRSARPLLAPALQDALVRTPAGDFSAAMWQEALTYLSGLRAPGADASACRRSLLDAIAAAAPSPS